MTIFSTKLGFCNFSLFHIYILIITMIPTRPARNAGTGKPVNLPAYYNQTYNKLYTPLRRGSAAEKPQV